MKLKDFKRGNRVNKLIDILKIPNFLNIFNNILKCINANFIEYVIRINKIF